MKLKTKGLLYLQLITSTYNDNKLIVRPSCATNNSSLLASCARNIEISYMTDHGWILYRKCNKMCMADTCSL